MSAQSKFITFEGGEGAGKSTQIRLLAEHLKKQGADSIITREPGGTPNAEKLREVLIANEWDVKTEVLLNFSSRNEHIEKVIKPALKQDKWVLCDRFYDSTYVYQGYAQGADIMLIDEIRRIVLGEFAPAKTFLLDIDPEIALKRAEARGEVNRFEKMGLEFHKRIRAGFLDLARKNKDRFIVIDADKSVEEVHEKIISQI